MLIAYPAIDLMAIEAKIASDLEIRKPLLHPKRKIVAVWHAVEKLILPP